MTDRVFFSSRSRCSDKSTLLLGLGLLLVLAGCDRPPAEERLRAVIDEMRGAVESGERAEFMDRVNDNFSGQTGRWDRDELNKIMRVMMLRHKSIGTTVADLEITFYETRATVSMKVLVTGGPSAWRPSNAEFINVTSGWVDSDDDWQLISADWQ